MGRLLKLVEQVIPLLTFYPRWAQVFFIIAFAFLLLSVFLFVLIYSSASKKREQFSTHRAQAKIAGDYNSRLDIPEDISRTPQQMAKSNVPMVGLSHYSYVPIRNKIQLKGHINIDDIDTVLLTVYVKNYGEVPADNYVFSYSIIYGSEEIYRTAQDDASLSKGTLLMPGQSSFNEIIFEKDMLLKLKSMTPIVLKIRLTYTDRAGDYKDDVRYTVWVNRNNNPFILKLSSLPHD